MKVGRWLPSTMLVVLAAVVIASSGCEAPKEKASSEGGTSTESAASEGAAAAAAPAVELVVADEKQFQEVLDKHRGKVVLVDFWATWCGPCVEHFPHTVELFNKHQADGLAAVTINFDELANADAVKEFLEKQQAGALDNLHSKYDGVGTEVTSAFEFEGVLPHYRLYDRAGKLRYRWDAPPDDLETKVTELLAESPEGADSPGS